MLRRVRARRPEVTCSPEATTTSYSSSDSSTPAPGRPAPSVQATSSLVLPAMAETTTATFLPLAASAATMRAARRMRSRSPIEVPPNFITSRSESGRVILAGCSVLRETARGFIAGAMVASNGTVSAREPQGAKEFNDQAAGPSIDPADVARFSAQAAEWWDARGPFAPLHRFNPARLAFVRDRAAERFGRTVKAREPFAGLTLLDVGCGGGLIAEPMRRMGFEVTAVDASAENIGTARAHAEQQGLDIGLQLFNRRRA